MSDAVWLGPPTGEAGTAQYSMHVDAAITESAETALEAVYVLLRGVARPPEEVSGQPPFASLGDRVWYGADEFGGRIIFLRTNVLGDVFIFHKEGLDPQMLFDLAALLGRKIDAALAGTPEPAPVLPPSAEDSHLTLQEAWEAHRAESAAR